MIMICLILPFLRLFATPHKMIAVGENSISVQPVGAVRVEVVPLASLRRVYLERGTGGDGADRDAIVIDAESLDSKVMLYYENLSVDPACLSVQGIFSLCFDCATILCECAFFQDF